MGHSGMTCGYLPLRVPKRSKLKVDLDAYNENGMRLQKLFRTTQKSYWKKKFCMQQVAKHVVSEHKLRNQEEK